MVDGKFTGKNNLKIDDKMPSYIYKKESGPTKRSGSRTLTFIIYRIKNNKPKYLGEVKRESASYRGDNATVAEFIAKKDHYAFDGYRLKRKDIYIREI